MFTLQHSLRKHTLARSRRQRKRTSQSKHQQPWYMLLAAKMIGCLPLWCWWQAEWSQPSSLWQVPGNQWQFAVVENKFNKRLNTYRLMIYPEWEPGDNDNHHGGQVDGDDVEGDLPDKQKLHLETTVLSSGRLDIAVLIASVTQNKSSRQT